MEMTKRFGINGFQLKMLAMLTMLIDHMGAILFPQYRWMRMIGRLAFPLFAFLLVEGFLHTRDVNAYLKRLTIFAILSEPVFDFAFSGRFFDMGHQNIFFTLALGVLLLKLLNENAEVSRRILWFVVIAFAAELIRCDYKTGGILTILIFYQYRNNRRMMSVFFAAAHMFLWGTLSIQSYAVFSLIPIFLYNGKRGTRVKYAFYIFYPVHLLVLGLIAKWMSGVHFWSMMIIS